MRLHTAILIAPAIPIAIPPGRFLFRRNRGDDQERFEAFDDLFAATRQLFATAATMKPHWSQDWEHRDKVQLPPKYQPDQYLYPGAVDAAYDAKFAHALLYQNRWRSRIEPLFESYDRDCWSQLRATIERSSQTFLHIKETHADAFREDEAGWIDGAVERFDRARYALRTAERNDIPDHELISTTTFQTVHSALRLSESMLDALRREALEQK